MPQRNPYVHDIVGTVSRGLEVGRQFQGLQANRQQMAQQQAEQAQKEKFQLGLQGLDFKNQEQIQQFAQKNPDYLQDIAIQQEFHEQQINTRIADLASVGYQAALTGDPLNVHDVLDRHAEELIDIDPSFSAERWKQIYDADPEQFKSLMAGELAQAGRGDFIEAARNRSENTAIEWAKLDARDRDSELRAAQTDLDRETNELKRDELRNKVKTLEDHKLTWGSMSQGRGETITADMSADTTAYQGLSRANNLILDAQKAGVSMKGSQFSSLVNRIRMGGMSPDDEAKYADAFGSATLDIARQIAISLRPVSGEQLKLVLDGLRGGSWSQAAQAIRGTMRDTENRYQSGYDELTRFGAGIANTYQNGLSFERVEDILNKERAVYEPQNHEPRNGDQKIPPGTPVISNDQGDEFYFINGQMIPVSSVQEPQPQQPQQPPVTPPVTPPAVTIPGFYR